ncbi:MAG: NUDIX hydrolase [Patescibacteria group bacterium]
MSSIPNQAKCVFKGIVFDVYQWEQEMFDGSKATFEMLKRADTVNVIATTGDKVMVIKQEQPGKQEFFGIPGGRIDEGEETLACAKRELLEETGFVSNDWEVFKVWQPYSKIDWRIHLYIARNCKKVADQTLDAGEKITVQLVAFDELVEFADDEQFLHVDLHNELILAKCDPVARQKLEEKLFG